MLPSAAIVPPETASSRAGERFGPQSFAWCLPMNPVHWLIDTVIELYIWVVIASVVLSWLIAFNVINTRNSFVHQVADFLNRATDPALRPIRNVLPNLGGIDISPIVLILLLVFIRRLIWQMFT
jgi:YggT family protein